MWNKIVSRFWLTVSRFSFLVKRFSFLVSHFSLNVSRFSLSVAHCGFLVLGLFVSRVGFAQGNENNVTESTMRSNGKIYVVVAICVTILAGLILYLISIDRKIGKIEDNNTP